MDTFLTVMSYSVTAIIFLALGGVLRQNKTWAAEAEAQMWKRIAEKHEAELRAMHEAEEIHSTELRRIGKMGKRRGAITGANA